jgi:hypothetical protein
MRALTLLSASALAYGFMPFAGRLGSVFGAVATVALGVLLALAASFGPNAVAVASGALGAFGSGVVANQAPALAGALLLVFAFSERTLRVRDKNSRIVHLLLAAGAGGVAGYLALHYAGSEILVRAVVVIVAAVLATAPLMIPADDALAHALDDLAGTVDAPAAAQLSAAAELRRSVDESLLDPASARDARRAWKSLLRLGRARSRLIGQRALNERAQAVVRRLDQRIADHVGSLTRMYTAADAASAAGVSLDDGALESVESAGETLDEVSKAMMEDVA